MGLSFRKSIKIGKNTRINLSKTGGIGISTGVKGARVSFNKKGVRTSVGAKGIYYTNSKSWNSGSKKSSVNYNNAVSIKPIKVQNIIEHGNDLAKIKKKVNITTSVTFICLIIGIVTLNIVLLLISIGLCIFMLTKSTQWNANLNNASNYINIYKFDKANKYLDKASRYKEDVIIDELRAYIETISNTQEDTVELSEENIELNNEVFEKQVDRNIKGKWFEKNNDIESAIALYELNIKEGFEGTHPYDRLVVLYRRLKKYDDEIRVINRGIEVFEGLYFNGIDVQKENYNSTLERYRERLNKTILLKSKNESN